MAAEGTPAEDMAEKEGTAKVPGPSTPPQRMPVNPIVDIPSGSPTETVLLSRSAAQLLSQSQSVPRDNT